MCRLQPEVRRRGGAVRPPIQLRAAAPTPPVALNSWHSAAHCVIYGEFKKDYARVFGGKPGNTTTTQKENNALF